MSLIIAFSGGKDSTAMVLRLSELGEDFKLLFTPTGDELPEQKGWPRWKIRSKTYSGIAAAMADQCSPLIGPREK